MILIFDLIDYVTALIKSQAEIVQFYCKIDKILYNIFII